MAMNEKSEIRESLMEVIGEEGCGVACEEADIFHDHEGWKMMLEGFMEPWKLGQPWRKPKKIFRNTPKWDSAWVEIPPGPPFSKGGKI
jgi:hypothetical protein